MALFSRSFLVGVAYKVLVGTTTLDPDDPRRPSLAVVEDAR